MTEPIEFVPPPIEVDITEHIAAIARGEEGMPPRTLVIRQGELPQNITLKVVDRPGPEMQWRRPGGEWTTGEYPPNEMVEVRWRKSVEGTFSEWPVAP
jgi:hypothetical protein